jgi:hypothetical protein
VVVEPEAVIVPAANATEGGNATTTEGGAGNSTTEGSGGAATTSQR